MSDRSTSAWCVVATALELTIPCGGQDHRIRWCHGAIELVDHEHLDAELALVALGGSEPACLSRSRLWDEAVSDGGFLGEWVDDARLNPAWFSWLTMALERMRSEGFHEFLRRLPPARAQRMGEFLDHFPMPWIDRAAAMVSDRAIDGPGVICEQATDLVADCIAHRLRRAFVDSVGGEELAVGAAALVPLAISVGGPPAAAGALDGPDRGVQISVPAGWLHHVWATGAQVIDGHLVLHIDLERGPRPGLVGQATVFGQTTMFGQATMIVWNRDDAGTRRPGLIGRTVRFDQDRWSLDE